MGVASRVGHSERQGCHYVRSHNGSLEPRRVPEQKLDLSRYQGPSLVPKPDEISRPAYRVNQQWIDDAEQVITTYKNDVCSWSEWRLRFRSVSPRSGKQMHELCQKAAYESAKSEDIIRVAMEQAEMD